MSETYLALLRAVNVGGKNKLPMKVLVEICKEAGCKNVRTFIQSGNVIFDATSRAQAQLPGKIASLIAERFGYRTPVIVRSLNQISDVVANNPFLEQGGAEEALHVLFLADVPAAEVVAGLDPNRSPGDAFIVRGQEIFLKLTNGVADCKLTNNYFDKKLGTISTGRNWRTVTKLLELMKG
jgi:uncharacterized protein (DUF1697 family)